MQTEQNGAEILTVSPYPVFFDQLSSIPEIERLRRFALVELYGLMDIGHASLSIGTEASSLSLFLPPSLFPRISSLELLQYLRSKESIKFPPVPDGAQPRIVLQRPEHDSAKTFNFYTFPLSQDINKHLLHRINY
jgi:hypothetical protein